MSVAGIAEEPRRGGDSGWLTMRAGGSGSRCTEARVCADGPVASSPAEVRRLWERAVSGRLLSRFRVSEVCAGIAGSLASTGLSQVEVLSGLKTGPGAAIDLAARALKPRVGSPAEAEVMVLLGGGRDATNKRLRKAAEPALRTTLLQLGARAIAGDLERDVFSPLLAATSGRWRSVGRDPDHPHSAERQRGGRTGQARRRSEPAEVSGERGSLVPRTA